MHILQAILQAIAPVDITHKLVWTAWGHLRMQNHPTPKCFRTNASQLRYWIVFYLKFCLSEKCLWREWLDWSQLASGHFSTSACSDRLATLSLGKVRYSFGWTPGKQKWGEGKPSESPPWKSALGFSLEPIWRSFLGAFGAMLVWTACYSNPWTAHVCKQDSIKKKVFFPVISIGIIAIMIITNMTMIMIITNIIMIITKMIMIIAITNMMMIMIITSRRLAWGWLVPLQPAWRSLCQVHCTPKLHCTPGTVNSMSLHCTAHQVQCILLYARYNILYTARQNCSARQAQCIALYVLYFVHPGPHNYTALNCMLHLAGHCTPIYLYWSAKVCAQ